MQSKPRELNRQGPEAGTTEGVADSEPGAGLLEAVVGLAVVVAVVVADKAAGDAVGVGFVTVPSVEMARSTQFQNSSGYAALPPQEDKERLHQVARSERSPKNEEYPGGRQVLAVMYFHWTTQWVHTKPTGS